MKDLDLKFNNMQEISKKFWGIPEENLRKVEEFREIIIFVDLSQYSQQSISATRNIYMLDSTEMKDIDLKFNNMLEYSKNILGIPEENL